MKLIILSCCQEQFSLVKVNSIEIIGDKASYSCPRCDGIHQSIIYKQELIINE